MIIRFGYCPPNPGPKARLKNKWFTNKEDAINEYNGGSIWVSNGRKYYEISYYELCNLKQ